MKEEIIGKCLFVANEQYGDDSLHAISLGVGFESDFRSCQ